jgi:Periplasmic protein involved in polysaccharide export
MPSQLYKKFDLVRVKFAGSSKEVMELLNGNAGIQLETVTKTPEGSEQIGQQVDPQGFLSYPLIGKVKAEGLTKEQLRLKLLELVAPILKEAYIMVDLPKRGVSMLGEVKSPASVLLIRERTNLLEALTQVGSVTEFADLANVKVYRENPDGSRLLGHLNLTDTSFLSSPFFYPLPDDVVYVPAVKQKNVKYFGQTYAPLATIILAISTLLITVLK